MSGSDYNIALLTFFILYILLEVPCNLLMKRIRPSVLLASLMLGFGIVTGSDLPSPDRGLDSTR